MFLILTGSYPVTHLNGQIHFGNQLCWKRLSIDLCAKLWGFLMTSMTLLNVLIYWYWAHFISSLHFAYFIMYSIFLCYSVLHHLFMSVEMWKQKTWQFISFAFVKNKWLHIMKCLSVSNHCVRALCPVGGAGDAGTCPICTKWSTEKERPGSWRDGNKDSLETWYSVVQ